MINDRRKSRSTDGFMLRRRTRLPDGSTRLGVEKLPVPQQFLEGKSAPMVDRRTAQAIGSSAQSTAGTHGINKSDIDASLRAIDADTPSLKRRRRLSRKVIKRAVMSILILLLLMGGFLGIKAILSGMSIFKGNIFDVFSSRKLREDTMGRTNIVVFGTSEDSQAHIDDGAGTELTDSIMVISLNQTTKDAAMVSIPRDLWVNYGSACTAGYEGKINAVYECYADGASVESGAKGLMDTLHDVTGLDMHYYVKVGYTTVKDAVDSVGGITVKIESDSPNGIYDPNFDWMCGYRCKMVKYPNGDVQLDGEHALALSRARDATGRGYGLGGGNFDREQYQQKIMIAIKDKAVSAGTLANPIKINSLIDTMGKNIKTNIETGEIRTLIGLASDIKPESIQRLSLNDQEKPLVATGSYGGQSIVRPVAGIEDFSEIQAYLKKQLSSDPAAREGATIEVLNATTTEGLATKKKAEFESQGLTIQSVGNAELASPPSGAVWYDLSSGQKPKTAAKLASVLGAQAAGSQAPDGVQSEADFVIIIGNGTD